MSYYEKGTITGTGPTPWVEGNHISFAHTFSSGGTLTLEWSLDGKTAHTIGSYTGTDSDYITNLGNFARYNCTSYSGDIDYEMKGHQQTY